MRRTLLLAVVPLLSAAPATAKMIDRDHKQVAAETVLMHAADPAAPGTCAAVVIAQFKDLRGYVGQNVDSLGHFPTGNISQSSSISAPFDDTYTSGGITWTAPAGQHWKVVYKSTGSGDCAAESARNATFFPDPLLITYGRTAPCSKLAAGAENAASAIKRDKTEVKFTASNKHDNRAARKKLKKDKAALKRFKAKLKKRC